MRTHSRINRTALYMLTHISGKQILQMYLERCLFRFLQAFSPTTSRSQILHCRLFKGLRPDFLINTNFHGILSNSITTNLIWNKSVCDCDTTARTLKHLTLTHFVWVMLWINLSKTYRKGCWHDFPFRQMGNIRLLFSGRYQSLLEDCRFLHIILGIWHYLVLAAVNELVVLLRRHEGTERPFYHLVQRRVDMHSVYYWFCALLRSVH